MSWLNDIANWYRQGYGNAVDKAGTLFNLDEYGVSEAIAKGPTTNTSFGASGAWDSNGPGGSNPIGDYPGGGTTSRNNTASTPSPNNRNDGGLGAQISLARAAAEEGRRRAGAAFDRARGIYDEGIGLLGKRRGEFKDIYDTGSNEILGRHEQERGNLQASNAGASEKLRNSLRALGLGGSAFLKGEGRQRQQAAKASGQLSTERAANDRTNLAGYNTNQDWANTQEGALNRFLNDAQSARTSAENQVSLTEQGDVNQINSNVNSLLNNIYAQQSALQATGGNISGYEANPYAPDMSSMLSAITGGIQQYGGAPSQANQATNVTQDKLSYLDKLKARAGGSIYA